MIASGRLYPPKCNTPEERLRYYASQFRLTEANSSYFAMTKRDVAELRAKREPPDFSHLGGASPEAFEHVSL